MDELNEQLNQSLNLNNCFNTWNMRKLLKNMEQITSICVERENCQSKRIRCN